MYDTSILEPAQINGVRLIIPPELFLPWHANISAVQTAEEGNGNIVNVITKMSTMKTDYSK